jgi:hypothetical protein
VRRSERWTFLAGEVATFTSTPEGYDMDIGWKYRIQRGDEIRSVRVIVAGGRLDSASLPRDSRRAIESRGWSAVNDVLHLDDPPQILIVGDGAFTPVDQDASGVYSRTGAGERRYSGGRWGSLLGGRSRSRSAALGSSTT